MRPSIAEINLSNLKYNYKNIRKKKSNVGVIAVIKADAYGHGAIQVAKTLNETDTPPEYLGVAFDIEAIELRNSGIKNQIILFEPLSEYNIKNVLRYKLIPTIFTQQHLELLKRKSWGKIKIQIDVDTGMGRLGIPSQDAFDFILKVANQKNIIIDGIYTHFATSDEKNKNYANEQLKKFISLIEKLKKNGINFGKAHAANSGAILDMPESYFDLIRPGVSLYGNYPSTETSESIKLKPVMKIVSAVSTIRWFEAGDYVSYGRRFQVKKRTQIVSVPMGYADGYSRGLTNKARAIIKNKFYPQVGTVTMDRIMFDVGKDKIKLGDKVVLLGKEKTKEISNFEWCQILNTIPYEITCNISKRVPRVYVR